MSASINVESAVGMQDYKPTPLKVLSAQEIWEDFLQGGEVFVQDRLEIVAGPFGVDDLELAVATYRSLVEANPSPSPVYRMANPATNYRLIIIPRVYAIVGKQLDL